MLATLFLQGELELSIATVPLPVPEADEVIVRIEAAPINPSDLGLLLGPADMRNAKITGDGVLRAPIPTKSLPSVKTRIGVAMTVGNEGSGVVVRAGAAEGERLVGRTVAILGAPTYQQFQAVKAKRCLVMPDGVTPREAASCFVNPLTALGMVETMKLEGHKALVHTGASKGPCNPG